MPFSKGPDRLPLMGKKEQEVKYQPRAESILSLQSSASSTMEH